MCAWVGLRSNIMVPSPSNSSIKYYHAESGFDDETHGAFKTKNSSVLMVSILAQLTQQKLMVLKLLSRRSFVIFQAKGETEKNGFSLACIILTHSFLNRLNSIYVSPENYLRKLT